MQKKHHLVVGTAGHIDHGKTTLVKALTGMDPDRLAEEKKRGITIDLGFANFHDEQGTQISFVDVPGHEKFIHNMLAGAAGIDAVLLIVAADEGVMPQTQEHLDICQLLQIPSGMVVLTRIDLVEDPDMIDLCQEEIREMVSGTFLENAPILPVSSHTGEGLDVVKQAFSKLYQGLKPREVDKPTRFLIDRSFSIKGFGTIVTGTVLRGTLEKEATIHQYPKNEAVRIRGLQVHNQEVKEAFAGQRVAINVAQLSKDEIQRGDQLAKPGTLLNTYMLNVELHLLPSLERPLKHRSRIRLYIGTMEVMGRVFPLEQTEVEPGSTQMVQLRLEAPVSCRFGDRFIIRNFSPIITLGGGTVLDPFPSKSRRIRGELVDRLKNMKLGDREAQVDQVVFLQSTRGVLASEIGPRIDLSEKQIAKFLQTLTSKKKVFCVDPQTKRYLHVDHVARIGSFVVRVLKSFHEKFAEREGMTKAELTGKLKLLFRTEKEVEHLLSHLVKNKFLEDDSKYFHLKGHQKTFSSEQTSDLERCVALIEEAGYQPPRRTVLLETLGLEAKPGKELLKIATHEKHLIRVAEDLFYTPTQIEELIKKVELFFEKQDQLTVIEFKDYLQIGRKHTIEILEYFDSKNLTVRIDNHREFRAK